MLSIGIIELVILIGLLVLVVLAAVALIVFLRRRSTPGPDARPGTARRGVSDSPGTTTNLTDPSTRTERPPTAPDQTQTATTTDPAGSRVTGGSTESADSDGPRQPEITALSPSLPRVDPDLRARSEQEAAQIRADADAYQRDVRGRADQLMREAQLARHDADDEVRSQRAEVREHRLDLERREHRLAEREERLDAETRALADKADQLESLKASLKVQRKSLDEAEVEHHQTLERIAALTTEQAKAELVGTVEHEAKRRAVIIERDIERQAVRDGEAKARSIIVSTIQRVASDQTSESVVSAVHLPGDDMKGRIIGREGRNIRSFEQVTGVNVMIDDTPESVLLSCFDPVRRETARMTLTELVRDGRIHPARIEEVHERSKTQIEEQCLRAAEDALVEVGISDLHPELVPILGSLRYRTSYGQNVLKHLVECAHIAGIMAAELGLDVAQCKRSAFLHDIGKALTHEVEGSHALIGADLARRFGEDPDVVHAIEAHHNEVEVHSVEAVLTQAADAISGSRPGARRESIEAYVQRLERLEEIASAREGVEKVFAMQAGREIRVMVAPDVVDDIEAQVLARDIAKQVEEELTYPGQIRVTVVRESRATETAR